MDELGTIAAEVAKDIEQADSAKDAGLRGDGVLNVSYDIGTDARIRAVEVSFNSRHARITVDVTNATLTASAGFDSHTTHIREDKAEMVLSDAEAWWISMVEGQSVRG